MNNFRLGTKAALAMAIAANIPSQAFSQESAGSSMLEEVLITAQKRTQSANDVGIAITAFGENQIQDFRIRTAQDLVAITPNLDYKTTNGGLNPAITIRGVGMNDFNINSSGAVGVYVDEVYLPSTALLTNINFDMERVEVLKGPQGTLYGRNSNGGAINFISKRPTFENEAYVMVGAGNFGMVETEGAVGGGFNDSIAGRLSVRYSDRDGYQDVVDSNKKLGELYSGTIRGQLLFEGDEFDINLSLTTSKGDGSTTAAESVGAFDPVTFDPCSSDRINNYQCADFTGYVPGTNKKPNKVEIGQGDIESLQTLDNRTNMANVSMNFNIGDMTLTSITSYLNMDRTWGEGVVDHTPVVDTFINISKNEKLSQATQELRLTGDTDKSNWVAGVFYSTDKVETSNKIDVIGFLQAVGVPPGETGNLPWEYEQKTDVAAIFGQYEYLLTDQWKIIAGARYSHEKRDFVGATYLNDSSGAIAGGDPFMLLDSADSDISESKPSGKLGLEYTPNADWLVYGSVSTGFKSGGYPGDFSFGPGAPGYEPYGTEDILAYEAGFKATLADGTVQLNSAVFYYQYDNMQTLISLPNATQPLTNADEATIAGFEADMMWKVTQRFDVMLNVGVLDHKMKDDNLGDKMPNTADLTYGGVLRYELPVFNTWALAFQTDFKWTDEMYRDAQNNEVLKADDFWNVGANISLFNDASGWHIAAWGKNLTNEEVLTFGFDSTGFSGNWGRAYSMPATYGMTVTKRFN